MQERLLHYFTKHSGLFLSNFRLSLHSFEADAIHDMRVAVKRIGAVFLLLERLSPDKSNVFNDENGLRELFRLSGRMRDIQVQQQLLESYAVMLGTTFSEYANYLENAEKKAIRKFKSYLREFDADNYINLKQTDVGDLIATTNNLQVRTQIIDYVDELMVAAETMRSGQEHDENLHEIRRKLKQCHYLLSIFDHDDPDLPQLNTTIKRLDKVNELLGDWHDQLVAMEMLDRFLKKFREKEIAGENRYLLLRENLSFKRQVLYDKILNYLEKKLEL